MEKPSLFTPISTDRYGFHIVVDRGTQFRETLFRKQLLFTISCHDLFVRSIFWRKVHNGFTR